MHVNVNDKIVNFGDNKYLFAIVYKFDFFSPDLKKTLLKAYYNKKGLITFDEREGYTILSDKVDKLDSSQKTIHISNDKVIFAIGEKFTYGEWIKFRDYLIEIYFDVVQDTDSFNVDSIDLRYSVVVPSDNLDLDFLSIFGTDSILSKSISEDMKNIVFFELYFKDKENNKKIYISIEEEEKEDEKKVQRINIGLPLVNIKDNVNIKEEVRKHLEKTDSQFLHINSTFVKKITK